MEVWNLLAVVAFGNYPGDWELERPLFSCLLVLPHQRQLYSYPDFTCTHTCVHMRLCMCVSKMITNQLILSYTWSPFLF